MIVLFVNKKMAIKGKNYNNYWETTEQDGLFFFLKNAEQDLIDNGIEYTIGEIEIKQEELE